MCGAKCEKAGWFCWDDEYMLYMGAPALNEAGM
jgi:hypothetical protein